MDKKKLLTIQAKLNAPKNQRNNFGGFNYRSCEDILTAVKPLLEETNTVLTLTDDIIVKGDNGFNSNDVILKQRYYIKATATLYDAETGEEIASVSALAREQEDKKGMDQSQISGASSSYARKYALNGLFCIDDSKDADAQMPAPTDIEGMLAVIASCKTSVALSQLAPAIGELRKTASSEEMDKLKSAYNARLKELK